MSADTLEKLVGDRLRGVNLSATASNKFDPLIEALAERWAIPRDSIVVKFVAHPKNHGNRISEGTGGTPARLVLLADEPVALDAMARTFGRCARLPVPTLVLAKARNQWTTVGVLLAPNAPDPFELDAPMARVELPKARFVNPGVREAVIARIGALAGSPVGVDIETVLSAFGVDDRVVAIKHVTESRNLVNRIGEGLRRRPPFLVVMSPPDLLAAVRRKLPEDLERSPETIAHVLHHGPDGLVVERIDAPGVGGVPSTPAESPDEPADDLFAREDEQAPRQIDEEPAPHDAEDESADDDASPDDETLSYRRLPRVELLRRHLPLDADADLLYAEHRGTIDDADAHETPTLDYLRRLLRAERTFVVLTGDAGHGKTHLCVEMLGGGAAAESILAGLAADTTGERAWSVDGASAPVRVMKDLSEVVPPERAARRLVELLDRSTDHVIVCANEGKLRAVVEHAPDELVPLLDALETGLTRGETHPPGRPDVHVVNLNAQAVTAETDGKPGFLVHVLDQFLNHEGAWRTCRSCRAKADCPILANRDRLVRPRGKLAGSGNGREALVELVRVAEEGGYVATFRETIALVAFLVTGGATCADVERMHSDARRHRELESHRVLELLFVRPLSNAARDAVPIVERLRRLDPGLVAFRPVDERIHRALEARGGFGSDLFDESTRQPNSRRELVREQETHRGLVRRERREAWFVSASIDEHGISRTARLGLRHRDAFRALLDGASVKAMLATLKRVVRGLHALQGAVGIDSTGDLHLVDPAFGRSGAHAAIIARSLSVESLQLVSESVWWTDRRGGDPVPVLDAIAWIDRRVLLIHADEPDDPVLSLDLLGFEFVMNAADGIVMREFHAAARRRLLRTLARRAQASGRSASGKIRVLVGGRGEARLIVERDHTIASGAGS